MKRGIPRVGVGENTRIESAIIDKTPDRGELRDLAGGQTRSILMGKLLHSGRNRNCSKRGGDPGRHDSLGGNDKPNRLAKRVRRTPKMIRVSIILLHGPCDLPRFWPFRCRLN